MKCHVYSRMELVTYIVGVKGSSNELAEALDPSATTNRHADSNKPFRGLNDKKVMYVERFGSTPVHKDNRPLIAEAKKRANLLNMDYADLDVV